jgi:shikimate kinase
MAGAGKSFLLNQLKNAYQGHTYQFIDLDHFIESLTNQKIVALWNNGSFRSAESFALNKLITQDHLVLALGGGTLSNNLDIIQSHSKLLWANTPFDTCFERIQASDRPLKNLSYSECYQLYQSRLNDYQKASQTLKSPLKKFELDA